MNKKISWPVLLIIAAICYFMDFLIGGLVGSAFGTIGVILLLIGVANFIAELFNKFKNKYSK